jgi:gamma-glutamylcyclotransferase (GGCT)/AIG2-like uncharacterized protein YtfP
MRGFALHRLLAAEGDLIGTGRIAGRLVDLGAYPGAVIDGAGVARGEVYRVRRAALWATLDSVEGAQYHREEVPVRLDGGGEVQAFVYWYRGPLDRSVPIPGGDYRAHAPAQSIARHPRSQEVRDGA